MVSDMGKVYSNDDVIALSSKEALTMMKSDDVLILLLSTNMNGVLCS